MSTTAETTMTTNATRTLIDARLDAIDRALLGRLSRAERLDVVGEVESRIDELLRERRGPDAEPSREDVLAILSLLDPPEAYLDDEAPVHDAEERPTPHRRVAPTTAAAPDARGANAPAILGLVAAAGWIICPLGWLIGIKAESEVVIGIFWGLAAIGMILGGGLAVTLGLVERPRRRTTMVGVIAGAAAFGFGLALAAMVACFAIMVSFS